MAVHFTFNDKEREKFKKRMKSPSSTKLAKALIQFTLLGFGVLTLLIKFHGGNVKRVIFGIRAVEYKADDLSEYPTLDLEELEARLKVQDFLNSPEEQLIAEKEEELRDEEALYADDSDDMKQNSEVTIETLGNLLFSDGTEYLSANDIAVNGLLSSKEYSKMWKLQELHDQYFSDNIHKRYVPHLAQSVTKLEFHQTFRQSSTPVIIPFETMRNHGFLTKAWTLEELRQRFPYTLPKSGKLPLAYTSKSGQKDGLDLGPALLALTQDQVLAKGKGFKRNFPRNLKIKSKYLSMLEISHPPFVPKQRFQPPTLWFGTSTADTRLHSDCCDNFVQMISGTKRWYISPPTDSRHLSPIKCEGKHQSLCWASVKYPNGPRSREMTVLEKEKLGVSNGMVFDLHAGEMLYLPAGWWHHIENLGPTIMVNFWTYGCENVAIALDQDPIRSDRADFKGCPAIAKNDATFLYS